MSQPGTLGERWTVDEEIYREFPPDVTLPEPGAVADGSPPLPAELD
jgi:hypothetical protein